MVHSNSNDVDRFAEHSNAGFPSRIRGLDGLRAISLMMVLAQHGYSSLPTEPFPVRRLTEVVANGVLGVNIFFVLSGYLITFLLKKELTQTGMVCLRSFYMRRILRIFPALYFYLITLSLMCIAGVIETSWQDFAISGVFALNYRHAFLPAVNETTMQGFWFIGHLWTFALEEQFYLLWPAAFVFAGLSRSPKICVALIIISPLLRVLTYYLWPAARGQLGGMVHCAGDSLMFGCLLALWQGTVCFEAIARRFHHWTIPVLAVVFLLVVSPELGQQFRGSYKMTLGISLDSLAITSVLLWVTSHQDGAVVRFLDLAPLRFLGVLSYSIYLWQQLVLAPSNITWTAVFPVNMILCVGLGWLSFRFVETPFLRLRDVFRVNTAVVKKAPTVLLFGKTGAD